MPPRRCDEPDLPAGRRRGPCALGRHAGGLRGFLGPRLVLLLLDKPAHGYELLERLTAEQPHMPTADPGLLYRTLRQLEADGLLVSTWDTAGQGPARRLYEVTPEGVAFLHAWAGRAEHMRACLGRFLDGYQRHFDPSEA
ncbi:MAG: PadR family transcriptional regulator [Chloroflexi bacterium]|nr:PadR family transcriptional regulator [Chloroflexota bacterium]